MEFFGELRKQIEYFDIKQMIIRSNIKENIHSISFSDEALNNLDYISIDVVVSDNLF